MTPTRGQVKSRFQSLLDDPAGEVFDETVFADAFGEAFDALFTAFLQYQVARIEIIAHITLPANTIARTPSELGIDGLGDFIYLSERPAPQTTGRYREMTAVDQLPQRAAGETLREFNYRNDTFYFNGSTQATSLEIKYASSGTAPTDDQALINVDGSLTFLSNYAVGAAGPRKGYDEVAARSMVKAVGPAYDRGAIGGELFRLVQTRVRSRQKEGPLAPRPFTADGRLSRRRAVPYIEAQPGTTG